MTGAALVLSVVDGRTGVVHLVAVEKVALHRRSGRYPTLCDNEVISASLMTEPAQECRYCLSRAQAGAGADRQREPAGRRRPRLSWPGRSRRAGPGTPQSRFRRGRGEGTYRNKCEGGRVGE